MEKEIECRWKRKKKIKKGRWSSNTYIKQNGFLNEDGNKRQRKALHIIKSSIKQEDIAHVNIYALK